MVGADTDRYLYVHDAASGDVLFRTRMHASAQGFPITYAVDGRQFIAVPCGRQSYERRSTRFALPQRPAR